jgi:poly [ADP-ribose] polymerase
MDTKQEAIENFITLYEEKTGNLWKNRNNFEKQPGKLYPLDIDYGEVLFVTPLVILMIYYLNN